MTRLCIGFMLFLFGAIARADCPADPGCPPQTVWDEATVVITVVSHGEPPSARLVVAAGPNGEPASVDIPIDDINTDLRRAPQA